jgi:hypothetical protein
MKVFGVGIVIVLMVGTVLQWLTREELKGLGRRSILAMKKSAH